MLHIIRFRATASTESASVKRQIARKKMRAPLDVKSSIMRIQNNSQNRGRWKFRVKRVCLCLE